MSVLRPLAAITPPLLILAAALAARAADPVYYPLAVGNAWEYKLQSALRTASMTATLSKTEKIDDVELFVLEGKIDGALVASEHLRATTEGVFRHRHTVFDAGKAGAPQVAIVVPPFKLFAYPAKEDGTWKGELTTNDPKEGAKKTEFTATSAPEEVTVPAGTYKTIRVKFELPAEKSEITYWFAENVGFVKQVIKTPDLEATLTLEKFTPAKAP